MWDPILCFSVMADIEIDPNLWGGSVIDTYALEPPGTKWDPIV